MFIDHNTCQLSEISISTLRAWARTIAFAADLASKEELLHADEHFLLIKNAQAGNLSGIDAELRECIHTQLASRQSSKF